MWTLRTAQLFCARIESIAIMYGCHVALTGGCLYKGGNRKDVDVILFKVRQKDKIDFKAMFDAFELASPGFIKPKDLKENGWLNKATYEDRPIDFLYPEAVYSTQETNYENAPNNDIVFKEFK